MNPLPDVLMNFRVHRVAFMMDIAAFFHQVLVDKKDADAFRFFWWANKECIRMILNKFLAHIFGSGASSCVTSYVLRYHAEVIKDMFGPEIYQIIHDLFYVDDGSGGADDVETALKHKEDLILAMKMGGFELTKWKSNYPELMDDTDQTEKIFSEAEEITKVLGMSWKPAVDLFTFKFNPKKGLHADTPRQLVSI